MKTCPNCGEMNGEANDKCYKCGADLSQISGERRCCPYCNEIYSPKVETCPKCERPTVVFDPFTMKQTYNGGSATGISCNLFISAFTPSATTS